MKEVKEKLKKITEEEKKNLKEFMPNML